MKNTKTPEPTYEIAYFTRTGLPRRKAVAQSKVPAVWARLEEQGCYNCWVSYHPVDPVALLNLSPVQEPIPA